jgi:hypothetical protein
MEAGLIPNHDDVYIRADFGSELFEEHVHDLRVNVR